MSATLNKAGLKAILSNWIASGDYPAPVHLFVNDFIPTPQSPASAYTEASFTGYAVVNLTTALFVESDQVDGSVLHLQPCSFKALNPSSGQIVYGCYITSRLDPTKVTLFSRFEQPIAVQAGILSALVLTIAIGLQQRTGG